MVAWLLSTWLAAGAAAGPAVRAVTIEGRTIEGVWLGTTSGGSVVLLQDGQKKEFSPGELMSLRFSGAVASRTSASRPAATSQPAAVYLANGGLLHGAIIDADARQITFKTAYVPELKLPLTSIAGVRFTAREHAGAAEVFKKALADRDPAQDTLLVVREDRVAALKGVTESLSPDGGSFKWHERSVPIRADNVYGLVFAAGTRKAGAPQAKVELTDGSIWAGRLAGGDANRVTVEPVDGLKADLPLGELNAIRFHSDRVVFLSDLEPEEYAFEPLATTSWPYRRDRSAANRPMRIGDQDFERGLGMHSQSTLTYSLPGEFNRLAAVIGIDAAVAPLGNAVFRVTADDKEAFNSGPVTGRDSPRAINVPIGGARRIQLIVEFGADLDIGDQADWGNVRLIK